MDLESINGWYNLYFNLSIVFSTTNVLPLKGPKEKFA